MSTDRSIPRTTTDAGIPVQSDEHSLTLGRIFEPGLRRRDIDHLARVGIDRKRSDCKLADIGFETGGFAIDDGQFDDVIAHPALSSTTFHRGAAGGGVHGNRQAVRPGAPCARHGGWD